jgi:hypothetical protein
MVSESFVMCISSKNVRFPCCTLYFLMRFEMLDKVLRLADDLLRPTEDFVIRT